MVNGSCEGVSSLGTLSEAVPEAVSKAVPETVLEAFPVEEVPETVSGIRNQISRAKSLYILFLIKFIFCFY